MKQLLTTALICLAVCCACDDHSREEKAAAKTELYRNRERQERLLIQKYTSQHMTEHLLSLGDTAGAEFYQYRTDSLSAALDILELKGKRLELQLERIEAEANRE